jgi:hypothetical protein
VVISPTSIINSKPMLSRSLLRWQFQLQRRRLQIRVSG